MSKIMFFTDIHIPAVHPAAFNHCVNIKKIYKPDIIVIGGDIFDLHRASFHDHEPNSPSLYDEVQLCSEMIQPWIKEFPDAYVCESNHDSRIYRVAKKVGIPLDFIKPYHEIFNLPESWKFVEEIIFDGVRYSHGESCFGNAAGHHKSVMNHRQSQVYGHWHSHAGVVWSATEKDLLFGMNAGCLADRKHLALRYGRNFVHKPIVGCAIIVEGKFPLFIPADLGDK